MRIEHVALWTEDIERLCAFYRTYFGATVGDRYTNASKGFESRFLTFDSGARLEVMRTTSMSPIKLQPAAQRMGLTHLAITVDSQRTVDELTARLRADGHTIIGNPRRTGDGYYESVVTDPDGNLIEITG